VVGEVLKIQHDKYEVKSKKKGLSEDLIEHFEEAMDLNKNLEWGINHMFEDLNPFKAYQLFMNIPAEDIPFLDMDERLARPIDMIITHLPVPPVIIRPTVTQNSNITNEDDLTIHIK
jgi:DNA-directed RNA polymerase III subunit RPC1